VVRNVCVLFVARAGKHPVLLFQYVFEGCSCLAHGSNHGLMSTVVGAVSGWNFQLTQLL
jgi:hypothetical protein